MNKLDNIMTVIMVVCVSYSMAEWRISEYKKGYRCQPITEHKTLESAKAQVSAYHAMVRG